MLPPEKKPSDRFPPAKITSVPWSGSTPPRKVLAIRLQAFGDIVATLPYLQSLRRKLVGGRLDLLTRREFVELPASLHLFDQIHSIRGKRNPYLQRISAMMVAPRMRRQNYDLIVDLQNNPISRLIRQKTHCRAWSEFDVLSPIPHGERVRQTIDAVWPIGAQLDCAFELRNPQLGLELVDPADRKRELVVLNPAGFYKTRHWPIENYVEFARLWQRHENPNARFLLLGLPRIREQANYIQRQLPESTINLVEQTSVAQAFSILQNVRFVLSEDSGLLHMAWCSGIPNLALLGSSRSDWTRPLGPHSTFLGSGDLACGQCMQPECRFGDVRCLTRYNAEYVFGLARELLRRCA